jgi:hypothetical protein
MVHANKNEHGLRLKADPKTTVHRAVVRTGVSLLEKNIEVGEVRRDNTLTDPNAFSLSSVSKIDFAKLPRKRDLCGDVIPYILIRKLMAVEQSFEPKLPFWRKRE